MLTCIAGAYPAVTQPLTAALGIAGELAAAPTGAETPAASRERIGLGTYHIRLLDELSLLTDELLLKRMKIRQIDFPEF